MHEKSNNLFALVKTNVLNHNCEQLVIEINHYALKLCIFQMQTKITVQRKDPCLSKSMMFNHWKDKIYEIAFYK